MFKTRTKADWSILSTYRPFLYFSAAISIILYHFTSIFSYYPALVRPRIATFYFNLINSIGVEVFFFLSGISLYFAYTKKKSIQSFLKDRFRKILIPYILFGGFFWLFEYIILHKGSVYDFIKDFFFISFFTKGENRFWYVLAILVFYCLYVCINKFLFQMRGNSILKLILILICTYASLWFFSKSAIYNNIQIAIMRFPIFVLGCYYGKKVYNKEYINGVEIIFAILGIFLKIVTMSMHLSMYETRIIQTLFAYSLCVFICMIINLFPFKKNNIIVTMWGGRSYELYLSNVAIIKLIIDLGFNAVKYYHCIIMLCLIISYFMPYIYNLILKIEKKLSNFFKIHNLLFLFLIIICVKTLLNLDLETISVPSDEFNPISVAAQITGLDWSNAIVSNGYYGYLASITYIPAFLLLRMTGNGLDLYQSLLFINTIYSAIYGLVIYKILQKIDNASLGSAHYFILSLIAVCIPQFYGVTLITNNDVIYSLLHVLSLYCLIKCIDINNQFNKGLYSTLCAIFSVLTLGSNNRGIVIILAIPITVIIIRIIYKKWVINPIVFLVTLILMLSLHYGILYPYFKNFYPLETYNTDAGLILKRIPRILTNWQDLKVCLIALIGWIYSFIISTYGMGLFLLTILIYFILALFRKQKIFSIAEGTVNTFLLFWLAGTACLCIIFFLDSFQGLLQYNTSIASNPTRSDKLFYFRYFIALAPFGCSYSLLQILKNNILKKPYLYIMAIIMTVTLLIFHGYIGVYIQGTSYAPSSTNFIGLFLQNWTENYRYGTIHSGKFLYCTFLAIILIISMLYSVYKNKQWSYWHCILFLEIITCIYYTGYYMAPRTKVSNSCVDKNITEFIENNDSCSVFVEDSNKVFLYQFSMPEKIVYQNFEYQDVLILNTQTYFDTYTDGYTLIETDEDNYRLYIRSP